MCLRRTIFGAQLKPETAACLALDKFYSLGRQVALKYAQRILAKLRALQRANAQQ